MMISSFGKRYGCDFYVNSTWNRCGEQFCEKDNENMKESEREKEKKRNENQFDIVMNDREKEKPES